MVDYTWGLDGFLSPATLPCAPAITPVAVILLLSGSSQDDQRSVQSVCRWQIDCTEQGTVGEGLARVRGPHRVPGSQAKPPSVAEARCCPLVIIPRRLSYHRRWALAPSASASLLLVLVKDLVVLVLVLGSGSGSRLFFPPSLCNDDWTRHPSPASTTLLARSA